MVKGITSPLTRIRTGTYVGDGNATQAITSLGFGPDMVIIFQSGYAGCENFAKTSDMGVNAQRLNGPGQIANVIISLDANGFTIGNASSINDNLIVYNFIAMRNL